MRTGMCYWRFKGEKAYRFGYCSEATSGLYRMGFWNGDTRHDPFVFPNDVETMPY